MLECLAWRCVGSRCRWQGGTGTTYNRNRKSMRYQLLANSALDAGRTKSVLMIHQHSYFWQAAVCRMFCFFWGRNMDFVDHIFERFLAFEAGLGLALWSLWLKRVWKLTKRSWFPIKHQWVMWNTKSWVFNDYRVCWKVPISNLFGVGFCRKTLRSVSLYPKTWLMISSSETKLGYNIYQNRIYYDMFIFACIYILYCMYTYSVTYYFYDLMNFETLSTWSCFIARGPPRLRFYRRPMSPFSLREAAYTKDRPMITCWKNREVETSVFF